MSAPARLKWWTSPRTVLRHILLLDDTPHAIALGTAVGMFIGMTPTVGTQMILVMLFAAATRRWFHFNRVAALITVYVSNPVTMVPIYYLDYKVGTLFFGGSLTRDDFAAILQYEGLAQWWDVFAGLLLGVGLPLIVGSLVVAGVCSAATYPLMRRLLRLTRGETGALR